jgi:hypothetical protein
MSYKRLTQKSNNGLWGIDGKLVDQRQSGDKVFAEAFNIIINRLAELEDKIENGTLVELPCKVGDKVYCVYHFDDVWDKDLEYDIIPEEVVDIIVKEDDFDIGTACRMIGKFQRVCVCLTKAEAEKKLEELKGGAK